MTVPEMERRVPMRSMRSSQIPETSGKGWKAMLYSRVWSLAFVVTDEVELM